MVQGDCGVAALTPRRGVLDTHFSMGGALTLSWTVLGSHTRCKRIYFGTYICSAVQFSDPTGWVAVSFRLLHMLVLTGTFVQRRLGR